MKKIPTLFRRDLSKQPALVVADVVPSATWVLRGEGVATRKYDGQACAVLNGVFVKRREIKDGKPLPADFIEADFDEETGKRVGWVPVSDGPEDAYFREALPPDGSLPDEGTFELVGPKVQGNPENYGNHSLIRHSEAEVLADAPRDFEGLRSYFRKHNIEGIVWHHADGRMAKIKAKDFGIKRASQTPPSEEKNDEY